MTENQVCANCNIIIVLSLLLRLYCDGKGMVAIMLKTSINVWQNLEVSYLNAFIDLILTKHIAYAFLINVIWTGSITSFDCAFEDELLRRSRPRCLSTQISRHSSGNQSARRCDMHGPLARYVKLRVRMRRECRERFPCHQR